MIANNENQSLAEHKKAFEFVVGSLIIFTICTLALVFFHWNIYSSLALIALGIFVGALYSRRKFQSWVSFVAWKIAQDAKHPTAIQRLLSFVYIIITGFSLNVINKYFGISFEAMVGMMEILVGLAIGYFLWTLWLHGKFGKAIEKRF